MPIRNEQERKVWLAAYRQRNRKKIQKVQHAWSLAHPQYMLWRHAYQRAQYQGIPFDIEKSDIVIPDECPILHIKLSQTGNRDNRPSVDRIVPEKGYVKGNIQVISMRANRIKSDATLEELERIVENLRSHR
jgi:hypothetical protein